MGSISLVFFYAERVYRVTEALLDCTHCLHVYIGVSSEIIHGSKLYSFVEWK